MRYAPTLALINEARRNPKLSITKQRWPSNEEAEGERPRQCCSFPSCSRIEFVYLAMSVSTHFYGVGPLQQISSGPLRS